MTFKEKLESEKELIADQIKNPKKHNIIHFFKRNIVNYKLVMNNLAPYIVAFVISFPSAKAASKTPFKIDNIEQQAKIEIIDSSNGTHAEHIKYEDDATGTLEHSTSWRINEYGLYERTQTKYILYMLNNVDINDYETIFSMTKEELDAALVPFEQQVITKPELSEEDKMYNEEVIAIHSLVDTDIVRSVKETSASNTLNTFIYVDICFALGFSITKIRKVIFGETIKNNLVEEKKKYVKIDEEQIKRLQEKLRLIENDLELFQEEKVR